MHGSQTDPYRLFFPLGILLGIAGVAIWPLYYYGVTEGYSGRAHAFVQIEGFLYSFAAGFLLTAVPRFTGTDVPTRRIQYILAALLVAAAVSFELQAFAIGSTAFLAAHVVLMVLAARRFAQRRHKPPSTFVLLGMGLITGTVGGFLNAGVAWELIAPSWDLLGKRLLTEGMFLMLVLGVGGFLGPRLLGFAQLTGPEVENGMVGFSPALSIVYGVAGVVILFTLITEYGFGFERMALLRALVTSMVLLGTVQPWRRPIVRSTLSWCVWTANILVMCAVWLVALAPRYRVDLLHILFIGGFTLLILAVGTRVTLSHGGHSLSLERASWPLRVGLAAGLVAMLARIGAPLAAFSYFEHLAFAAVMWIAGMTFWGLYLIRLIRRKANDDRERHR